ncbi:hypothetical protein QM480_07170 [Flectobacillus sp. DC10W]|uniref:Uncharacterized protein n=1 Tax=Flectobacillus longus TaxID=2984207 RepID=A0ABT6YKH6_9BACT|nr:hypothetical protein [Flectobacillus longus]MDI9864097.1 hypothetical protein [Flectobacillus longus]
MKRKLTFILMNKIKTYTIGWDIIHKIGYLTVLDETGKEYIFSELSLEELTFLQTMLQNPSVLIDPQNWIVAGWQINSSVNMRK